MTWFTPDQPKQLHEYPIVCGLWDLSLGPYDSGGLRVVRFSHFLAQTRPDIIFFEETRHTPAMATTKFNVNAILARAATSLQLMGAFKGELVRYATERDIPCVGVSIQAIKKFATNKGNANKEDMIRAAVEQFDVALDVEGYDNTGHDNVADALFILALGLHEYGAGVRPCDQ